MTLKYKLKYDLNLIPKTETIEINDEEKKQSDKSAIPNLDLEYLENIAMECFQVKQASPSQYLSKLIFMISV